MCVKGYFPGVSYIGCLGVSKVFCYGVSYILESIEGAEDGLFEDSDSL